MTQSKTNNNSKKLEKYRKIQKDYDKYFSYLYSKLNSKEKD